ncbi:MAG: putative DNA-binding domain-containing protein [Gammaproteobacteria bacterium]|nr:putative DNA-binding domain-containing protein [Gammaproteobacteria bacterium]
MGALKRGPQGCAPGTVRIKPLPSLPELQRAFAAAVYTDDEAIARHVHDGRFPAARLLQVYRNNVFTSLTSALQAVYPVVERLVGTGFFAYAADGYIRHHPPASGNLHDFGDSFAGFLAGFEPARALAYLPDVARLEWAWHRAFHAADGGPLALAALAAVLPGHYGELRFRLHPSAQLLASDYPILRIWQVNQPDHASDAIVDLAEGGVRLLVVRRGLDVAVESLGAGDDALLRAFAAGQNLEQAGAAALAVAPDYDLPAALQNHVARATLVDFSIPGEKP